MGNMRVVVLHSEVVEGAGRDEEDVLDQVDAVSRALANLGFDPVPAVFSADLDELREIVCKSGAAFAFNLVETVKGSGRLIHTAPGMLELLAVPFTGSGSEAMFLTSNKTAAKRVLRDAGVITPEWFSIKDLRSRSHPLNGPYIVKSVWEHASIGLDENAVIVPRDCDELLSELERRRKSLGGECFAEAFIDGREFNISILEQNGRPAVLPPAEIRFDSYPEGRRRFVDYRAKWDPSSFEYENTPRTFEFSAEDSVLLKRLTDISLRCWDAFDLMGYARVDYRVDRAGIPWALEVNANPCLNPDAGFAAAAQRAGLDYAQVVERIVAGATSTS